MLKHKQTYFFSVQGKLEQQVSSVQESQTLSSLAPAAHSDSSPQHSSGPQGELPVTLKNRKKMYYYYYYFF